MGGRVGGKKQNQGRGQAASLSQFRKSLIHSSIVAILGGAVAPTVAWAQESPSLETLQRENQQLRQELEALKRASTPAPAATSEPLAAEAIAAEAEPEQAAASNEPEELDRVVVSGKKTLLRVKEVPQSISVVSGEDLKRQDAVTLEAITKRLANVKWNYGNSSTSNYSIRGLGKIANLDNGDPSVGINVDGVALAFNQLAYFNFVDVDTVEVSRGPQGTQFGKNSTIGGIKVNYKRPSFTPYSEVTVGFSKYQDQDYGDSNGSVKSTAISTGPLIDGLLAYRATVNVDKGGGWIRNSYNPDNRYISSDRVTGRVQLLATPSPNFDAKLALEVSPRNSENVNIGSTNFFFTQTPGRYADGSINDSLTTEGRLSRRWFVRNTDYTVPGDYFNQEFIASDTQQGVVTGANGANLELNWNLADKYQLSSISSFRDYYFNAFRDDEGTVFDVQTAAGQNKVYSQATQEFRLVSRFGDLADYQAGLFLQRAISDSAGNAIFGTDAGAWFATTQQYGRLDPTAVGPLGVSGRLLLNDSLADLWKKTPTKTENTSAALYANADWHVSEPLTVNTGIRFGHEKRELTTSAFIKENGYGAALNPGNLGGFNSASNGDLSTTNTAEQLALADGLAQRYFGATNYAALSTQQRQQVADAKAIRNGRIGAIYAPYTADAYSDEIGTFSIAPRYKFNENVTGYFSLAYGQKSGLPGVLSTTGALVEYEVKPEKNKAFELGVKTNLLNGDLAFNAAVYLNDITDYQQNVFVVDELATAAQGNPALPPVFVAIAGNVPKVRAQGVEIDTVYTGIKNTSLRFAGAFNDSRYKDFPNLAKPVERGNERPVFRDASGETLPGVSKWSFSVGADHNLFFGDNKVFRSSFTTAYLSSFNSDNALSDYAVISDHSTTDVSFAFGNTKGKTEVGFFVKNVLDDDTPRNKTWNAWAPDFPRQYGVTFSSRF